MFSPLPGWHAIHPQMVLFPIALLLIAPLFVVIGALRQAGRGYPFMLSALLLMVLGTASIYVTAAAGEAVRIQDRDIPGTAGMAFSVLTLIFASIVFLPRALKQSPSLAISRVLPLVFLVFYAAGAVSLANSHQGSLPRPLITASGGR